MRRAALLALALCAAAPPCSGQQMWPTTKVWDSGPSDRRVDLVILGDGYQANEIPLFQSHVGNFINYWFNTAPFTKYKNLINVWRVDAHSNQSGSDHPLPCYSNPVAVDTIFDTRYCTGGVQRCIQPGGSTASLTALLNVPEYDEILIFVNDPEYGGCAGAIACATGVHSAASDVAVHELGHSIFALADEYGGGGTYTGPQFSQVNASNQDGPTMTANSSKWHYWLGTENIGAFEGCHYHDFGAWRPRNDCKMRSLGASFCAVCREASVEGCWLHVTGLDTATPPPGPDVVGVQPITAEIPIPEGSPVSTEWRVDGVPVGPGTQTVMGPVVQLGFDPTAAIGAGTATHLVELRVFDPTPWRIAASSAAVMPFQQWHMSTQVFDLEMQDVTVLVPPGRRGELFTVQTTVTNHGPAPSPPMDVLIRVATVNGLLAPTDARRITLPSLPPGATDVRAIDCRYAAGGGSVFPDVAVEGVVDPDGLQSEADESNNSFTGPSFPIDPAPSLTSSMTLGHWSIPAVIDLDIDAGAAHGNEDYYLFVSAAPPMPTDLGPFIGTLDFTADGLTDIVATGALGPPIFRDFFGTLDGSGLGTAIFDKPALFGIPPAPLFFNYLTLESGGGSTVVPIVGNLASVLFLP